MKYLNNMQEINNCFLWYLHIGHPLSMSESDLTSASLHTVQEAPYSPSLLTETSVVPIEEKVLALHQEKVNDGETEESVVPFADKGELWNVCKYLFILKCLFFKQCSIYMQLSFNKDVF